MATEHAHLWQVARTRKRLLVALTRDELRRPFTGSVVGVAWVVLHPLLIIGLYLFVFGSLFGLRLGASSSAQDYALYLVAGLLSWTAWATVIVQACHSVVANAGLVKQPHFPAELLPLRSVILAVISQLVGFLAIVGYAIARSRGPAWTYLLLPVAVLLQAMAMLGVAYVLAAAAVFLKDVKELATAFVTVGVYLVPAFYTPAMLERLPSAVRAVIAWNPLGVYMDLYRDCLVWTQVTRPWSWVVAVAFALVLPAVGRRIFGRLRLFFGNLL